VDARRTQIPFPETRVANMYPARIIGLVLRIRPSPHEGPLLPLTDLHFDETLHPGVPGTNIVKDFLSPALSNGVLYQRATGYFSSAVLAQTAQGIADFASNRGRIQLVTSHALTAVDSSTLDDYLRSDIFAKKLVDDFENSVAKFDGVATAIEKNYLGAMCWMLREGILEIKIVVPRKQLNDDEQAYGIEKFHPKFGVITDDEGNRMAFAGSVNETSSGWTRNVENVNVFCDWKHGQRNFVESFEAQFQRYWNNENLGDWVCIDLPTAVKNEIIDRHAPEDFPDIAENPAEQGFSGLRGYQESAVKAWLDSGCTGILEMATGTGKTKTALACREEVLKKGQKLLTLVIAPYQHICGQWAKELFSESPLEIPGGGDWRAKLRGLVPDLKLGRRDSLTLIAVKNTAATKDFVDQISELRPYFEDFLIIADEVHWLGARTFQTSLHEMANLRLGLSATPSRHFDEGGTQVLVDYFKGTIFKFSLRDALNWKLSDGKAVLTPYVYKPIFVSLTAEEEDEYAKFSKSIAVLMNRELTASQRDDLDMLRIRRANIAKSAANKIDAFVKLLAELPKPIRFCLIYCANHEQLDLAAESLRNAGVFFQKITGEEGTTPQVRFQMKNERQRILENFEAGHLDVLLAIDCLDEGVDIPAAQIGIILASSGNPKEFIQRRGRLMRRFPGKSESRIYDFAVLPAPPSTMGGPLSPAVPPQTVPDALRIGELRRIGEFAEDALNADEVQTTISHLTKGDVLT